MSFFNTIAELVKGLGKQGGANRNLTQGVMGLLGGRGLQGLVDSFAKNGLEDVVKSWIGTGANKNISVDQLKRALGEKQIAELASKAGVPADQASNLLKDLLPRIIDKATPNGKIVNK